MISNSKGFSLIEVLISMAILSVGLIGLIKMQSYIEVKSKNALITLDALHSAEEKMEFFRTRAQSTAGGTILYSSIIDSDEVVTVAGISASRKVIVKDNSPIPGVKTVFVSVTWQDRWQQQQQVTLESIVSQYSEYD